MNCIFNIDGNVLYIIPTEDLTTNRQYTVTITNVSGIIPLNGGTTDTLINTYTFWFTSVYCPLFTTLKRIKLIVGPGADVLLDDTIYRMIHKNSLDAIELFNLSTTNDYAYDHFGCGWQDVPLKLKRYVECKTAYDILAMLKQIQNGSGGGNQTKTLGDMSIKYGSSTTSGGDSGLDSPTKMKELYDCWNEMLRSFKFVRTAVKGFFDSSKGFSHPVREPDHNRVMRPVVVNGRNTNPNGPWVNSDSWRRFDI